MRPSLTSTWYCTSSASRWMHAATRSFILMRYKMGCLKQIHSSSSTVHPIPSLYCSGEYVLGFCRIYLPMADHVLLADFGLAVKTGRDLSRRANGCGTTVRSLIPSLLTFCFVVQIKNRIKVFPWAVVRTRRNNVVLVRTCYYIVTPPFVCNGVDNFTWRQRWW